MSKELEEDIRVLEEYHIQVIEYKNGFKSVRDVNKNENCNGIYIYANEEKYNKRHIDELLENSISKDTIKEKIQELKERRKLYDENNYKDIEMINTLSNIIITLENLLNNN